MKFVAFERAKQGTGASRRLRNTGKTPGIVYGGEGQPQLIELDPNPSKFVRQMAFGADDYDVLSPLGVRQAERHVGVGQTAHAPTSFTNWNDCSTPGATSATMSGSPTTSA